MDPQRMHATLIQAAPSRSLPPAGGLPHGVGFAGLLGAPNDRSKANLVHQLQKLAEVYLPVLLAEAAEGVDFFVELPSLQREQRRVRQG